MSLKLVSVNVEKRKHLGRVSEFLIRENADIACLMEVCEQDLDNLLLHYPHRVFGANFKLKTGETIGVAVASKQPIAHSSVFYADNKGEEDIPFEALGGHRPVMVEGETSGLKIGAVHFTWTPKASVTEKQRKHLKQLLTWLEVEGELVLCGDFNIPRGNEMYQKLTQVMKDNIPYEVESTVDPILHYANKQEKGKLKLVVDYVWSTPKYKISGVRVVSGVSDHCAIVCEVSKVT